MKNSRRGTLTLTIILYVLMFIYAVFTTMIGTQLLVLLDEFQMPLRAGGVFSVVVNGGSIVGILISSFFLDRFDKGKLVAVSFLIFGVLLALVKFSSSYIGFLSLLLWLGISMKFLDASLNATVTVLNPENSGFYMNLLHCSFGIGAFAGPVFTTLLMNNGIPWRDTYFYLGMAALIIFAIFMIMKSKAPKIQTQERETDVKITYKRLLTPRVLCLMAILFCYCGHQIGINNWLPTYLQKEMGLSVSAANLSVSVFWVGLIVSRLISAILTKHMPVERILKYETICAAALLMAGILSRNTVLTIGGVACAGLFAGAVIPLVLTIGYSWFPQALGKISTALFLCIAGGAVVFPWLMGVVSEQGSLYSGMLLDAVCLVLVMVFAAVALPQIVKKTKTSE